MEISYETFSKDDLPYEFVRRKRPFCGEDFSGTNLCHSNFDRIDSDI